MYNDFAEIYDRYWMQEAPAFFKKVLSRLVISELPLGARILDLCCGTGHIAAWLSGNGFNVTGVDSSEKMLEIARQNAPRVEFLCQDAETFSINKKVPLVISVFDSLNHILTEDGLLSVFSRVKNSLEAGGKFLFDLNDIAAFSGNWKNGFSIVEDNHVCMVKTAFDEKDNLVCYYITAFKKKGRNYKRVDLLVQERYYAESSVLRLLNRAGFKNIQILEGLKDLKIKQFKGRLFYLVF